MKLKLIKYTLFIALTLGCSGVFGQTEETGLTQDSLLLNEQDYFADSTQKNEDGFFSMFEGDPGRAALYSAVIPGGGQIYNKRWLKAPIVWGLEGTAIGFIIFFNKQHKSVDLAYKGLVRGEIDSWNGYTDPAGLKQLRNKVKQRRDYTILGLVGAHLLNIADAFVDRHLMEFDVDEDISLQIGPSDHGIGLTFAF